jgi:toxin secretion/phage lysis holin
MGVLIGSLELLKIGDYQKFLLSVGAILGASFSFIVGGVDVAIQWLIVLAITDYITGMIGAFKTGKWSSSNGFKGITKKTIMFGIIGICVGLDSIMKLHTFRDIAIFAYAVNEAGSILENIDKMGLGSIIPSFLRNGIAQLKQKNEEKEIKLK